MTLKRKTRKFVTQQVDERGRLDDEQRYINLTGSDTDHNVLLGLQGGTTDEYYHLTSAEHGNIANWDAAYTHSQIAGGNSVHVSTTENTQWDAAYAHIHNLTTDINHNALTNTHNLTTDINHNALTNTHNLTTDINHDALTNVHQDVNTTATPEFARLTVTPTTGVGVDIDSSGTTGTGLSVSSTRDGTQEWQLVRFKVTNAAFDQTVLEISNAGRSYGLYIISSQGASQLVPLVKVWADSSAFNKVVVNIINDGSAEGLYVETNTTGKGIFIDNNSTSFGMHIDNTQSSNLGLFVYSIKSASANELVEFKADHTGFGQAVVKIHQNDISEGCINFAASARGAITGATDSVQSVRVELNDTVYRVALYADA